MNPAIEAAWIAGGSGVLGVLIGIAGTVTATVVGFRSTRTATKETNDAGAASIREQIEAERRNRVWDQQAQIYVDILATANFRQTKREYQTQTSPLDPEVSKQFEAYLAIWRTPDVYQMEGRIIAFASEPVVTAVQASSTAEREARAAYNRWQQESSASGAESEASKVAAVAAEAARKAAEAADDAIVELIRSELIGHGRPLGDWQILPEPTPGIGQVRR